MEHCEAHCVQAAAPVAGFYGRCRVRQHHPLHPLAAAGGVEVPQNARELAAGLGKVGGAAEGGGDAQLPIQRLLQLAVLLAVRVGRGAAGVRWATPGHPRRESSPPRPLRAPLPRPQNARCMQGMQAAPIGCLRLGRGWSQPRWKRKEFKNCKQGAAPSLQAVMWRLRAAAARRPSPASPPPSLHSPHQGTRALRPQELQHQMPPQAAPGPEEQAEQAQAARRRRSLVLVAATAVVWTLLVASYLTPRPVFLAKPPITRCARWSSAASPKQPETPQDGLPPLGAPPRCRQPPSVQGASKPSAPCAPLQAPRRLLLL